MKVRNKPTDSTPTDLKGKLKEMLLETKRKDERGVVIQITGEWGTGKTHFWRRFAKENATKWIWRWIPEWIWRRKDFIYVSLFNKPDVGAINASILAQFNRRRYGLGFFRAIIIVIILALTLAGVSGIHYFFALGLVAVLVVLHFDGFVSMTRISILGMTFTVSDKVRNLTAKEMNKVVVCFDDFERLPKTLKIEDVLGLVAQLKEEQRCRVVMIFNSEKISEGKELLQKYYDKVVDYSFVHNPTPATSYHIAETEVAPEEVREFIRPFTSGNKSSFLSYFEAHKINNIRIIVIALQDVEHTLPILNDALRDDPDLFTARLQEYYASRVIALSCSNSIFGKEHVREVLEVWEYREVAIPRKRQEHRYAEAEYQRVGKAHKDVMEAYEQEKEKAKLLLEDKNYLDYYGLERRLGDIIDDLEKNGQYRGGIAEQYGFDKKDLPALKDYKKAKDDIKVSGNKISKAIEGLERVRGEFEKAEGIASEKETKLAKSPYKEVVSHLREGFEIISSEGSGGKIDYSAVLDLILFNCFAEFKISSEELHTSSKSYLDKLGRQIIAAHLNATLYQAFHVDVLDPTISKEALFEEVCTTLNKYKGELVHLLNISDLYTAIKQIKELSPSSPSQDFPNLEDEVTSFIKEITSNIDDEHVNYVSDLFDNWLSSKIKFFPLNSSQMILARKRDLEAFASLPIGAPRSYSPNMKNMKETFPKAWKVIVGRKRSIDEKLKAGFENHPAETLETLLFKPIVYGSREEYVENYPLPIFVAANSISEPQLCSVLKGKHLQSIISKLEDAYTDTPPVFPVSAIPISHSPDDHTLSPIYEPAPEYKELCKLIGRVHACLRKMVESDNRDIRISAEKTLTRYKKFFNV